MPVTSSLSRSTSALLTALLVLSFSAARQAYGAISPEAGAFFMQQYGPKTYGQSAQNWGVTQDKRGVMYFANNNGVLEFDGSTWRTISFGLPAVSVLADSQGTVFVGSENDFGFLRPNADGELQFISLAERIAVSKRRLDKVRAIAATSAGVFFTTRDAVYRWQPDQQKLTSIPAPGVVRCYSINDSLYIYSPLSGLSRLEGGGFNPIPGTELIPRSSYWYLARLQGSLIIATRSELYRQEGDKFVRWKTDADPILQEAVIYSLVPLSKGDLAIATLRRGLLLISADGKLDRIVDRRSGLRSETIRSIFEDHQHGVWLALERGLARIDAQSNLTTFGDREGVGEAVYSIVRAKGKIYAGTPVGMSFLDHAEPGAVPRFTSLEGIRDQVITLLPFHGHVVAGTAIGLHVVSDVESVFNFKSRAVFDVAPSVKDDRILFAAGVDGLQVFRWDDPKLTLIDRLSAFDREFRTVLERPDGSLWITARSTIYLVDLRRKPVKIESFRLLEGVPEGWINAYRLSGDITFATARGLLRFDEASRRFVPDQRFGALASNGTHEVSVVRQSPNGNIWISGAGYQAILQKKQDGNGYQWIDAPLARAGIQLIYGLYVDDDSTAWVSGSDGGLVRYEARSLAAPSIPSLLLRRLESLKSKRVIINGESLLPSALSLPYSDNALRFEFALPDFQDPSHTEYQVRLQGLDREWSNWTTEIQKEYTNLYEKQYTLQVRARNVLGVVTVPTQFSFRMRPPWYRTWWSFILYFAAMLGVVAITIRMRLHQLAVRNHRLEAIITARTSKIREQRDELAAKEKETDALLLNILPPQVAEELRKTGKVQPVSRPDVAICFTDFVGFTLSSETMSAQQLVAALHKYFVAFDDVISRYGLEKLKTIGDAYMFVGGVPESRRSFAVDTVLAAMELVQIVERFASEDPKHGWKVRVGVHCGSAITGVVGSKKFAFDIWGNSVNLASRMESSGHPNSVNLSSDAYELVKDFIECEPRGLVKTKEGRYFQMYFARGIKAELLKEEHLFSDLYTERFARVPPSLEAFLAAEKVSSQPV